MKLCVSPRNTVSIGDAENDHELLRLAEIGAAVEWGSRSLQAAADVVITGRGPSAVGDFVTRIAAGGRLPTQSERDADYFSDALRTVASSPWRFAGGTC